MAEEKKKTTTKKTTKKTETPKEVKKKTEPKKEKIKVVKEEVAKKATPKKEPKPKVTNEVPKEPTVEEKLERTMIFDGAQKKNLKEVVEKLEKENIVLKDKVIKRSKAKKVIVLILIALIAIGAVYVGVYLGSTLKEEMKQEEVIPTLNTNIYDKVYQYREEIKDKESDNKEEEKGVIRTITLSEFERKVIAKENMNVLVSSKTCYFCMTFEPIIEEVLKDTDKVIYRIDIESMEDSEVNKFREYYAFTITPTIFVIKDGIVVSERLGTMDKATFESWSNTNLQ